MRKYSGALLTEDQIREDITSRRTERNDRADRLLERYLKTECVNDRLRDLMDKNPKKARNLALVLEKQEGHIVKEAAKTVQSVDYLSPEKIMKIVRLGYPNSVRGEIFTEYPMVSANDVIYYLSPVYSEAKRGSVKGSVTHESPAYRYATPIEEMDVGTADGTNKDFSVTLSVKPLQKFSVKIFDSGIQVGVDNGDGSITGTGITGSINYTTGALSLTFTTAPANGNKITVSYDYVSEDPSLYDQIGSVELRLTPYNFRLNQYPLNVSWSQMTEVLLESSFDIDTEDTLVKAMGEELKKSLDFLAIRTAYQAAISNGNDFLTTFSKTPATGEGNVMKAQEFTRSVSEAGNKIFKSLQRGGVQNMIGGPDAVTYIELHQKFVANEQPNIGVHKKGDLNGKGVYKAPVNIIPDDEILTTYDNENYEGDMSLVCATMIPLYITPKLQRDTLNTEVGFAHYGDLKVLQPKYLTRIKLV